MANNYNYRRNLQKIESNAAPINEQEKLLNNIGMISFVIVEITEYLDTHPNDSEAIDYFNYYANLKNQLLIEYAEKFTPLTLSTAAKTSKKWEWALYPPPWKEMEN